MLQKVNAALAAPAQRFVLVIEEINRGNPAQIFGELLTLLEAGKRTPREAMQLCCPDPDGAQRPVHVPENLFGIGTMNLADRTLALVDMPFLRRFAFIDLEPCLGQAFRIGHSTVSPSRAWFVEVMESTLKPLLREVWFDAPDVVDREADRLLEGW